MLKYNFKRIIRARALDRPFSFLRQAGFSNYLATSICRNRVKRMNLKEIERVCLAFNCTPNELMEWTPPTRLENDNTIALNKLIHSRKVVDIAQSLSFLPMDELDKIEEMIESRRPE